jgi:hypothetical protein
MVLTDLIVREGSKIEIFSLDTGRLPVETYDLIAEVRKHYGLALRLYYPRHDLVEAYTHANGINAFYESVELRKGCCHWCARSSPCNARWLAAKPGSPACARSRRRPATACRCAASTPPTVAWKSSTRSPTGANAKSGPTSSSTRFPTMPCTTDSTRASAARRARGPITPGRRCPRRPLVVGKSGIQGMRLAHQARL